MISTEMSAIESLFTQLSITDYKYYKHNAVMNADQHEIVLKDILNTHPNIKLAKNLFLKGIYIHNIYNNT